MLILVQRVLVLVISLIFTVACTSQTDQAATAQPTEPLEEPSIPTPPATETEMTASWRTLDLRYAHVLEVTFKILDSTPVRFDVTLVHDDDGEAPQFADWWQVEDLSGQVLGTRVLTHSHGTQPFTRSAIIDIPADVKVVIVRGHDMLHGFGGQVIRLDLATGEQAFLSQHP